MSQSIISVAPFHMKYSRKSDFEPEFVSIGPYYYSEFDDNQHMKAIKEDCTSYFFNKPEDSSTTTTESIDDQLTDSSTVVNEDIEKFISSINRDDMEEKIRKWYGTGSTDHLDQKTLFEILLRDSCFVIRIILSDAGEGHKSTFFQLGRDIKRLRFDLLLLENQIPFFFLMKVYEFFYNNEMLRESKPQDTSSQSSPEQTISTCVDPQDTPRSDILKKFLKELESFISLDMPWKFNEYEIKEEPCHLLDLYWRRCLPLNNWAEICSGNKDTIPHNNEMTSSWKIIMDRTYAPKQIKNAYELYKKAGVKFGKTKHDEGFRLTFKKNGILQLPHLQLDPNQAKLLVNLVAFEEFKPSNEKILTSYVLLIDGLISTEKDVELLQRYGVLTNKLGSSQKASIYFNDIGNLCLVEYDNHYCKDQFEGLESYYKSYWRCKFAILKNKYFNSPWSVISFIAGLILLAITIAQLVLASINTYFNLKYHKH